MIRVLTINQTRDAGRDSFYVKLKPTSKRHRGQRVYKDAFGNALVILPADH